MIICDYIFGTAAATSQHLVLDVIVNGALLLIGCDSERVTVSAWASISSSVPNLWGLQGFLWWRQHLWFSKTKMVWSHSLVLKYVLRAPDIDNYRHQFVSQNPLLSSVEAMRSELDAFCFHCRLHQKKIQIYCLCSLLLFLLVFKISAARLHTEKPGFFALSLEYGFRKHPWEKSLMKNAPASFA